MNSYAGMIAATVIVVLLFTSAAVPQAVSGDEMDRRLNSATDHVQMANIYGKDSRVFVPQFQRPWNMIGQIRTDEKTICTAFLVNECTVATVGHCFRNKESTGSLYYTNPKFFPAGEAALPLQNIRAGDPAQGTIGEWGVAQIPVSRDGKYIGERNDSFAIEVTTAYDLGNDRKSVYCLAGYSTDKLKDGVPALSADPDVTIKSHREVLNGAGPEQCILHTGDAFSGASGGPIFRCRRNADGNFEFRPNVVAMHIGAAQRDNQQINPRFPDVSKLGFWELSTGIAGAGFVEHLEKYANDHPCRSSSGKPLVTHPSSDRR